MPGLKQARLFLLYWALWASSSAVAAEPAAVVPPQLAGALAADGTLLPGISGSFDASGWSLDTTAQGPPRFVPAQPIDKAGCGDGWDDRFTMRGTIGSVKAVAVVGDTVYLGGQFTVAGGPISYLARWDGTGFSAVGTGVNNGVLAFAVDGADLYAAGYLTEAGGLPARGIARWDGTNWSALGTGMNAGTINALAVWNGDLYAAGTFTTAGGVAAARVARWDGTSWWPVGDGLNNSVWALAADATGLYAGGSFTASGAVAINRIARWDGVAWAPLGAGVDNIVSALAAQGGNLYATGGFTTAGGAPASRIARWDGSTWSALGAGLNNGGRGLAFLGGDLYVGGAFTSAGGVSAPLIARWDGVAWSDVDGGMSGTGAPTVDALTLLPDGLGGGSIFAGGTFRRGGSVSALNVARWDGTAWFPLGDGQAPDDRVLSLALGTDAEGGKVVYAGGSFLQAGSEQAKYVAAWDVDAGTWRTLGTGVNGAVRTVAANGTDLYVGGTFTIAGIYQAYYVARWDGTAWTRLGIGTNGQVEVLQLCPNGAGGYDLYAGGNFTRAGGVTVNRLAKWDGTAWSALGTGFNNWVEAIAFADNGAGGYDVYAGGQFTTAGDVPANRIAKWDGTAWSPLGSGLAEVTGTGFPAVVEELLVSNDGAGGLVLYAGGLFTEAGGLRVGHIAKWDGTSWSALGSGLDWSVHAMDMRDGALHVGGAFLNAGGMPAAGIATWDGTTWSPLGDGLTPGIDMLIFDGDDMYVGGINTRAGCTPSYFFGRQRRGMISGIGSDLPAADVALAQNAPNPFNPLTEISFRLERSSHATLRVYDTRGRVVATLVDGALAAGDHRVSFSARGLASGLYMYRLEAGGVVESRKMMLVR